MEVNRLIIRQDKLVDVIKSLVPHRDRIWFHEYEHILQTFCEAKILMVYASATIDSELCLTVEFCSSHDKMLFALKYL
jgi:hypothetical protein